MKNLIQIHKKKTTKVMEIQILQECRDARLITFLQTEAQAQLK